MRLAVSILALTSFCASFAVAADEPAPRWWKGNLHTHTLWSDGNDYPEMVADWYKQRGYNFLALSDHNIVSTVERWIPVGKTAVSQAALDKYVARFGEKWVESRDNAGQKEVRLKKLAEFRVPLEEPQHFLMIPSEEITAKNVHINATNVQELILPYTAFDQNDSESIVKTIQRTLDAIMDQRRRTGVPILPHVNHPNFKWALTAEELMQLDNDLFFEVYNGHPQVYSRGDAEHASTDRVWDIILTERLGRLGKSNVFGLATDDSHQYHNEPKKLSHPGRGWVQVRAKSLRAEDLIAGMEAADFYASSGVTLKDVRREKNGISIEIEPEPGVTYTTEFIGTRKGYNGASEPVLGEYDKPPRVTRRYSQDIGAVLATSTSLSCSYTLRGDEIYVRARVTSSKPKVDPAEPGEFEQAWVQPIVGAAK
jgi:hypothetical protein